MAEQRAHSQTVGIFHAVLKIYQSSWLIVDASSVYVSVRNRLVSVWCPCSQQICCLIWMPNTEILPALFSIQMAVIQCRSEFWTHIFLSFFPWNKSVWQSNDSNVRSHEWNRSNFWMSNRLSHQQANTHEQLFVAADPHINYMWEWTCEATEKRCKPEAPCMLASR